MSGGLHSCGPLPLFHTFSTWGVSEGRGSQRSCWWSVLSRTVKLLGHNCCRHLQQKRRSRRTLSVGQKCCVLSACRCWSHVHQKLTEKLTSKDLTWCHQVGGIYSISPENECDYVLDCGFWIKTTNYNSERNQKPYKSKLDSDSKWHTEQQIEADCDVLCEWRARP